MACRGLSTGPACSIGHGPRNGSPPRGTHGGPGSWRDARPHTMPVWGMWDDSTLWFTSAAESRKVKNLRHDPRCCVTTEDASDPVIIEGVARFVTDTPTLQRVVDLMNAKYHSGVDLDFLQPARNATIGVRPRRVFSMLHSDFTGSPTRWVFDEE